jgi:hypothetical protein
VSADGDFDAFLLKYRADRTLDWARTYGTPLNSETGFDDEFATGLAVAPDGSVYVTGQFGTGVLFLAKFDPLGNLLWDSTWGENGTIGSGAAIGPDGSIYVSGSSFVLNGGGSDTEALLIKFDPPAAALNGRRWRSTDITSRDAGRASALGPGDSLLASRPPTLARR